MNGRSIHRAAKILIIVREFPTLVKKFVPDRDLPSRARSQKIRKKSDILRALFSHKIVCLQKTLEYNQKVPLLRQRRMCLLQTDFILSLAERLKEEEINTAIDTAGFVPREQLEKAASAADIFLYDLKCISEDLHTAGTGFSNKLILENLTYLSENFPGDIIIRIPIIPGFNDSDAELLKMRSFLDGINYKKIELLAYHSMAKSKYEALSKEFTNFPVPDEALMNRCRRIIGA